MGYLSLEDILRHKRFFALILDKIIKSGPVWKKGVCEYHLDKRKERGHLPEEATTEYYNKIIMRLLNEPKNELILHTDGVKYVVGNKKWIVILKNSGEVETCFPPDNYKKYLSRYKKIGKLEEVFPYVEL